MLSLLTSSSEQYQTSNSNHDYFQHCDDLVTTTEDYINRNFSEVTKSDEFLMLSFEQVEGLLKLQSYPYRSEEVSYHGYRDGNHSYHPKFLTS